MKATGMWMALFLGASLRGAAETNGIPWHTVAAGGGASTGGVFTVAGTAGQVQADLSISGNRSVTGGFWAFMSTVPSPGGPHLSLWLVADGGAFVAWPDPSPGFALQECTDLVAGNWTDSTVRPVILGDEKQAEIGLTDPQHFYRLRRP